MHSAVPSPPEQQLRGHQVLAGCLFRNRPLADGVTPFENRFYNQTYIKDSSFKGLQGNHFIRVGELYNRLNFAVAFDNCTFQLEGRKDGLLPVAVMNQDKDTFEETTESIKDLVFCDQPLEVGIVDLTAGEEDTYYDVDDVIPDRLRLKVGPNLDKAAAVFGAFGTADDVNLQKFEALSVRSDGCERQDLAAVR
jgi:hypothetical protein